MTIRPDVLAVLEMARQEGRAPRVYVAGPFGAPTEFQIHQNIERAFAVAAALWAKGYGVLCPHANTANMGGLATREMFLRGDLAWVAVTDIIVMMDTWLLSQGAIGEHDFAKERGVVVVYPGEIDQLPDLTGEPA